MMTIIAGSRQGIFQSDVDLAMSQCGWTPTVVLCGKARGADTWGEHWAKKRGIPVDPYPAQWLTCGNSAGPRRNVEMAMNADALVLVWDGRSKGSRHMLSVAKKRGMTVHEHDVFSEQHIRRCSHCRWSKWDGEAQRLACLFPWPWNKPGERSWAMREDRRTRCEKWERAPGADDEK